MKPKRVYIDTSVVGGCLDPEFSGPSLELFFRFRTGTMVALISELLHVELAPAPPGVRAMLERVGESREDVRITPEVDRLAERYIAQSVVGRANASDALHVAAATVHQADVLVTWDRKHIVHPLRTHGYNAVNANEGYARLVILTPAEVLR